MLLLEAPTPRPRIVTLDAPVVGAFGVCCVTEERDKISTESTTVKVLLCWTTRPATPFILLAEITTAR